MRQSSKRNGRQQCELTQICNKRRSRPGRLPALVLGLALLGTGLLGGTGRLAAAGDKAPQPQAYASWSAGGQGYGGRGIYQGCLVLSQTKLWLQYGVRSAEDFCPDDMMYWLQGQGLIAGWNPWMGSGWQEAMVRASGQRMEYLGFVSTAGKSREEIRAGLVAAADRQQVAILEMPTHYVVTDMEQSRYYRDVRIMDSLNYKDADQRQAANCSAFDETYSYGSLGGYYLFGPGPVYKQEQAARAEAQRRQSRLEHFRLNAPLLQRTPAGNYYISYHFDSAQGISNPRLSLSNAQGQKLSALSYRWQGEELRFYLPTTGLGGTSGQQETWRLNLSFGLEQEARTYFQTLDLPRGILPLNK